MNISMCVLNERKGGLYIDLLMSVRYSHEAWKGRVCSWRTDTVASFGKFKLPPKPNPARPGNGARACVVNQS